LKITEVNSYNFNTHCALLLLINISNTPTINQVQINHTKSGNQTTEVDLGLALTAFQKRITCQQGVKSIVLNPDPARADLLELGVKLQKNAMKKKAIFYIIEHFCKPTSFYLLITTMHYSIAHL
jgi:hypothetical protein